MQFTGAEKVKTHLFNNMSNGKLSEFIANDKGKDWHTLLIKKVRSLYPGWKKRKSRNTEVNAAANIVEKKRKPTFRAFQLEMLSRKRGNLCLFIHTFGCRLGKRGIVIFKRLSPWNFFSWESKGFIFIAGPINACSEFYYSVVVMRIRNEDWFSLRKTREKTMGKWNYLFPPLLKLMQNGRSQNESSIRLNQIRWTRFIHLLISSVDFSRWNSHNGEYSSLPNRRTTYKLYKILVSSKCDQL